MLFFKKNQEPFRFRSENGRVILEKYRGNDEDVEIPETYNGEPVVGIGENAFYDQAKIRSVRLPKGVEFIFSGAFRGLRSLETVILNEGLIEIGDGAFEKCTALEEIRLPETLKTIGRRAFAACSALKRAYIGSSAKEIGEKAFKGCSKELAVAVMNPDAAISEDALAGALYVYQASEYGLALTHYNGHEETLALESEFMSVPVAALGESLFSMFAYLKSVRL